MIKSSASLVRVWLGLGEGQHLSIHPWHNYCGNQIGRKTEPKTASLTFLMDICYVVAGVAIGLPSNPINHC